MNDHRFDVNKLLVMLSNDMYNYLLAKTEAADADDCYTDDQSCCGNNHHDNQCCKQIQQNSVD